MTDFYELHSDAAIRDLERCEPFSHAQKVAVQKLALAAWTAALSPEPVDKATADRCRDGVLTAIERTVGAA